MKFWNRPIRPADRARRLSTSARCPNRNGRLRLEDLEGRTLLSTYTISEVLNPFTGAKGVSVQVNTSPATVTYNPTTTVVVNTASGTDTVDILNTSEGLPIEIAGQGQDTVNVGNNGSVQGIVGSVSFGPSASFTAININDASDTVAYTATFGSYTPSGDTAWGSITGLAPGAIDYRYANTVAVNVNASTGSDTFNVQATGAPLVLNDGGYGTVNVGNAGSVQGIAATLTVQDSGNYNTLNVSDSADTTARNVTLANNGGVAFWGGITGLAPATILYEDTHTNYVYVTTGTGSDTVNVQETSVPLVLDDEGASTVNVGSFNSVQGIAASMTVEDTAGSDALNINDSADTTARNVTLSNQGGIAIWGLVTGLAPATIAYGDSSTRSVDVTTGTGSDTVNVQQASVPVVLDDEGAGTVNVGNAGSVQSIVAQLTVEDTDGSDTVSINDSIDATARNVTMGNYLGVAVWGTITGLAPATIFYEDGHASSLSVTTGAVSDTVNVQATGAPTYLIGGWNDTVNVGSGGTVSGILNTLYLENPPAYNTININDGSDSTARTVTLNSYTPSGDTPWGSITGLAPAAIDYRYVDTTSVDLTTGTASNTVVNVLATGARTYLIGEMYDTVNVGTAGSGAGNLAGILGAVYVENPSWSTTLNVNDGIRHHGPDGHPQLLHPLGRYALGLDHRSGDGDDQLPIRQHQRPDPHHRHGFRHGQCPGDGHDDEPHRWMGRHGQHRQRRDRLRHPRDPLPEESPRVQHHQRQRRVRHHGADGHPQLLHALGRLGLGLDHRPRAGGDRLQVCRHGQPESQHRHRFRHGQRPGDRRVQPTSTAGGTTRSTSATTGSSPASSGPST